MIKYRIISSDICILSCIIQSAKARSRYFVAFSQGKMESVTF